MTYNKLILQLSGLYGFERKYSPTETRFSYNDERLSILIIVTVDGGLTVIKYPGGDDEEIVLLNTKYMSEKDPFDLLVKVLKSEMVIFTHDTFDQITNIFTPVEINLSKRVICQYHNITLILRLYEEVLLMIMDESIKIDLLDIVSGSIIYKLSSLLDDEYLHEANLSKRVYDEITSNLKLLADPSEFEFFSQHLTQNSLSGLVNILYHDPIRLFDNNLLSVQTLIEVAPYLKYNNIYVNHCPKGAEVVIYTTSGEPILNVDRAIITGNSEVKIQDAGTVNLFHHASAVVSKVRTVTTRGGSNLEVSDASEVYAHDYSNVTVSRVVGKVFAQDHSSVFTYFPEDVFIHSEDARLVNLKELDEHAEAIFRRKIELVNED